MPPPNLHEIICTCMCIRNTAESRFQLDPGPVNMPVWVLESQTYCEGYFLEDMEEQGC